MDESRRRAIDVGGRALSYAEYGDPDGAPVLFCHGTPGTRLLAETFDDDAAEAGVRLIAPDRPGMGRSDPQSNRSLAGWSRDVTALVEALDLDAVGVVGFSGGGPHALATAADPDLAGRLTGVGLLAGAGPPDAPRRRRAR